MCADSAGLVEVALPVPLFQTFTYALEKGSSAVPPSGSRLVVPFRNRREIGICIALGAQTGDVSRLFVRHGLWLTGAGVALGVLAAVGLTRFIGWGFCRNAIGSGLAARL